MSRQIVLAVDGSDSSEEALEYVLGSFRPDDYLVTVATVIPETPHYMEEYADVDTDEIFDSFSRASDDYTREVVERLSQRGFTAERETLEGHPGEEICRLSEKHNAHTIVMGRRGLGAVEELLLGSVSQFVVHHASCPVVLVPGPGGETS